MFASFFPPLSIGLATGAAGALPGGIGAPGGAAFTLSAFPAAASVLDPDTEGSADIEALKSGLDGLGTESAIIIQPFAQAPIAVPPTQSPRVLSAPVESEAPLPAAIVPKSRSHPMTANVQQRAIDDLQPAPFDGDPVASEQSSLEGAEGAKLAPKAQISVTSNLVLPAPLRATESLVITEGEGPDFAEPPQGPTETRHPAQAPSVALSQHTPPVDAAAVRSAIAGAIAVRSNERAIEVHLNPPELGRVTLTFSSAAQDITAVTVAAESGETLDLIRRHADSLLRDLAARGFERVELSFASSDDASREYSKPTAFAAPASELHSAADLTATTDDPVVAPPVWRDGRIDWRV